MRKFEIGAAVFIFGRIYAGWKGTKFERNNSLDAIALYNMLYWQNVYKWLQIYTLKWGTKQSTDKY